jgi:lipopolysaccharide export system permease protein
MQATVGTARGATIARYLRRQALGASAMTLAVLIAISLVLFLGELLGDVAEGRALVSTLFELLMLRVPEAVLLTAPLALAVGLLMSFGELAQGEEFSVMRAAGMRPGRIVRVVSGVTLTWAAGLLVVGGWVAPWAEQRSSTMTERMADELLLAGLQPGQFQSMAGGRMSIYVRAVDAQSERLEDVFVHFDDGARIETVTARSGQLFTHPDTGRRVLALRDGMHIGHADTPDALPMRRIEFERNDLELPVIAERGGGDRLAALDPLSLVTADTAGRRLELERRALPAISCLVLALLVLPITLSGSRGRRFGSVLLVIVFYLLYTNTANLALARMPPDGIGLWPVHAAALAIAAVPLVWWWRRW